MKPRIAHIVCCSWCRHAVYRPVLPGHYCGRADLRLIEDTATVPEWCPLPSEQFIPKTADGHLIYPGMKVFICEPYSTIKSYPATIYNVGDGEPSETNDYSCVLSENRFFDGEYWNDGNTESVSVLYADEAECLRVANEKYAAFLEDQESRRKKKEEQNVPSNLPG